MSQPNDQEHMPTELAIPAADWQQTPPRVQTRILSLLKRLEALESRLHQASTTSNRPRSSEVPDNTPRQRPTSAAPRKAGGKPGHPGHRQALLAPTTVREVRPERCACGNPTLTRLRPYHTHQVLALPPIAMEVTHWVVHHGWCPDCGRWRKAQVPAEQATGYGPRCSALMGEVAGTYGNGRRMVQTLCGSVLRVPISLGAIQKVLDRVAQAIAPHDTAIATQARHAAVNSIDETPWFCVSTLQWVWVMASDTAAFSMIHPHRSTEAFAALIEDGQGILVSDGSGVYQRWVERRHTCLAHLIRTARSLAERGDSALAACGTWALAALQRLCHMATAPPTGGAWRAWYARLCKVIDQYHDRQDEAGRLVRRLLRETDSLWVFLVQHGVEPTNNRAERALRCRVTWRKRSLGTASGTGNRLVERMLSLKETCRLQAQSTSTGLVDAVTRFFHGQQPDLSWLT